MKTFSQKVAELAVHIPKGRVVTYGMLAKRAGGGAMASQSVSGVLGKAERAGSIIPWHRIVYAGGKIWIDDKHRAGRMKLYEQENIEIDAKGKIIDFEEKLWDFK